MKFVIVVSPLKLGLVQSINERVLKIKSWFFLSFSLYFHTPFTLSLLLLCLSAVLLLSLFLSISPSLSFPLFL